MSKRLAAAAAGAVLIAAAVLAFSLGKHPIVAGTNTAAPIYPAMPLSGGERRCQLVSRVPSAATHVRLLIDRLVGPPGDLRVQITGMNGEVLAVARTRVHLAGVVFRLKPPTRGLHPARICLTYLGRGDVVIAGEMKRIPSPTGRNASQKRSVASVVFLRPGLASWASRRDVIADRYANAQTGWLAGWALWLALALAAGAALLALWWLVFRFDAALLRRRSPREPRGPNA
jgi:hypothetical protein